MTPKPVLVTSSDASGISLCLMEQYRELKHRNAESEDEDVVADADSDLLSLSATLETASSEPVLMATACP